MSIWQSALPCAPCPPSAATTCLLAFFHFGDIRPPLDIQRLFTAQYSALTVHYSQALFNLSDMNILFRAACTTNAVSSTFDFKGVICTVLLIFPSSLPLSLSLMCFSSYCTEVAEVLFIMSLANSLAREREGETERELQLAWSLPRHENSFHSILSSDLSLPSFDLSNRTCM